jgi:DUF4097 and DUF4098 domain-containing protein YvlB
MRKTTLIIMVALLAFPALAAVQAVNETRSAAPDGVVAIQVLAGSISVAGWDRAEVNVTGRIDGEDYELKIEDSGKRTSISVEPIRKSMHHLDDTMELEIRVPHGGRVEAETLSADVTVEAVSGAVTVNSVSGTVEISGAVPEADVSTVSGTLILSTSTELRRGKFNSVSGTIVLKSELSPDGSFSFETVSGNIELHLPAGTSAEFDIESFSGDIENDFGQEATRTSEYLPSKSLEFSIGGGGASVSVSTINGDVELIRD